MSKLTLTFLFAVFSFFSFAQTITMLTSKTGVSLRGLSVVNDDVIWASGSKGTVARSFNGGSTFEWLTVTGYEQRDFRDIEAFNNNTAIIMAIAEPAVILKTKDGGKTWKKVFEDSTKGMFLDAMDFNGKYGVVIGDPINGKMFCAVTKDMGDHWKVQPEKERVELAKGEAFFASSGTNLTVLRLRKHHYTYMAVSGGSESGFINEKRKVKLDVLQQGKESQGANSIDGSMIWRIVVGGDFANDKDTSGNCALSFDMGKHWMKPHSSPHGYRSCVKFINSSIAITCGTSGVDISKDRGMNWTLISNESFHVCQKAKSGTAVFLAGKDGRIGKVIY